MGAVVLPFHPRLGGLVQQLEGQGLFTFEHGHQPPFDAAPEGFLLGVLVRGIGQGRLVHDAQASQTGDRLIGQHGSTVISHQRAWQTALHEGLAQAMNQALRGFLRIPLQMTDQARAIVEHAQQERLDPGPGWGDDPARAVMEIQMPERADVINLEAAHFALFEAIARGQRAVGRPLRPRLLEHALGTQVAPDGRIRRHPGRTILEHDAQIIDV